MLRWDTVVKALSVGALFVAALYFIFLHEAKVGSSKLVMALMFSAAVVVSMVLWFGWGCVRKQKLQRFSDRKELDHDVVYNQFFSSTNLPKDLVVELWSEVAANLDLPGNKLRPTDRFDNELGPVKGWEFDDEIGVLNWTAARRLKKLGAKADLATIKTLGDYVEFFGKLEMQSRMGVSDYRKQP